MSDEEIIKILNRLWSEILDREVALSAASTAHSEGLDSIRYIMIVVQTEDEFEIKFSASEIAHFGNVGDLVRAIHSKLLPVKGY